MGRQPRSFGDGQGQCAREWIDATFGQWRSQLTRPEEIALSEYKGDGYREINSALRGRTRMTEAVAQLIDDLDVAIMRMRLPEPVIVHRGVDHVALAQHPENLRGDVIEEHGYVSASLLRVVALEFLAELATPETGVLQRILIPGGTHVAVHAAAPDLILETHEYELLLPHGTELRVTGDNAGERYRELHLEVIP